MNSCILMLFLCFIVSYGAEQQHVTQPKVLEVDLHKLYDMPLLSNDDFILMIPHHLISCSSVLSNAQHFASNKHTSFGFSISELCLLLKLLNFESTHAHQLATKHQAFLQRVQSLDYVCYNYMLQRASKIFKGICFTTYTRTCAFELAHFFDMQATILCIANIGATQDLHYDMVKDLTAQKAHNCKNPYIPLYLKSIRQRLAEIDGIARYRYLKHAFVDPFFKGITILDLLRSGIITPQDSVQKQSALVLTEKKLYSLRGSEKIYCKDLYTTLILDYNLFTYISPTDIKLFGNLESLDLTGNHIDQVDFVSELPKLKSLVLAHNKIEYFSDNIQLLEHLEKLDISRNRLTHIVIKKGALNNLAELNVHTNHISYFKKEPDSLKNIQFIDFGINQMRTLPTKQFKSLNGLFLDANCIALLSNTTHTPNLTELSLADNHLTHLNDDITKLSQLRMLDLSDNTLIDIMPLSQLKLLTTLVLKRNKIDYHHAKQFFKLMLPDNQPEQLMTQLIRLDISGNPVSKSKISKLHKKVNKHRVPHEQLYVGRLQQLISK